MTLFRLLTEGTRALEEAGAPDARQDAQQLLLAAFQLDMVHFLMSRMQELEDDERNQGAMELYRRMIERRRRRCPLQQILGSQEFMGLEFYVNRHVLIPRQDTETLAELVLADMTAQDLAGVQAAFDRVTVTDISKEALKVAERNAAALLPGWRLCRGDDSSGQEGMEDRERAAEFWQGDLFAALPEDGRRYDVITSNPPYIPTAVIVTLEPEVREHEPMLALDGAEDGLYYYRRIAADAGRYLKPGGRIYLEIGFDQGAAVSSLLKANGYQDVRIYRDLSGKDRVVVACLLV